MVVHFDGKMLQNLLGREKVDRIAVLVSYNGTYKFLGAPKVDIANGKSIADAVYQTLVAWKLEKHVKGKSFDTTSVNTGKENGACVLLDGELKFDLVNLACRHHVRI